MKAMNRALVGFSVNTEHILTYNRSSTLEKGEIVSSKYNLGGTSFNVAQAISKLGGKSKLLALTGAKDSIETNTLHYLLSRSCEVPFIEYKVLDKSHFGFQPLDGLPNSHMFSGKGRILLEKMPKTLEKIQNESGKWRIATGIREAEVQLVKSLFRGHEGFRTLNPRREFIKNRELFFNLLKETDFLILNNQEFRACEVTSASELHKFGPRLIVVTDDKRGGTFSLLGSPPERFKACKYYIVEGNPIYKVGAGDWFSGAFHSKCIKHKKSFYELSIEEVREWINFSAEVAGKKVTMPGASNGPCLEDLKGDPP